MKLGCLSAKIITDGWFGLILKAAFQLRSLLTSVILDQPPREISPLSPDFTGARTQQSRAALLGRSYYTSITSVHSPYLD